MAARHSVRLHRCRFLDWSPSPITALAFPPALLSSKKLPGDAHPVLAVGRANGNIELWIWASSKSSRAGAASTNQGWVMHQVLYAPRPSKIDALAFAWRDTSSKGAPDDLGVLRLFSTTGGTLLFEWDLLHCSIRRSLPSQGGAIWCLAANPAGTALAIGCEDGCVRLVNIEGDKFVLKRKFDRVKTRILSIAWGPPVPPHKRKKTKVETDRMEDGDDSSEEDEDEWLDEWLVTGCSDSSLRKWEVKSGRALEKMSTDRTRSEPTLVWAVGVLSDGTIVSGDSMGIIKFWDRISCTQLQSFQSHGADVLCLAISPTNNAVYTSGVDQKVTEFLSVQLSGGGKQSLLSSTGQRRWIQSCSRRLHSHDVRCLAIWPPQSLTSRYASESNPSNMIPPILVSAGLDMSPVFVPCAAPETGIDPTTKAQNPFSKNGVAIFEDAHYHRAAISASPAVCFAAKARRLACWGETRVSVWRLGPGPIPEGEGIHAINSVRDEGWEKVLDMELRVKSSIVCCMMSQDGRWLAVSDVEDVKLFRLLGDEASGAIEPKRIKSLSAVLTNVLPDGVKRGATSLIFSPDSKKLILGVRHLGVLIIVGIDDGSEPRVLRVLEQHRQLDARARLLGVVSSSMGVDGAERITPEISRLSVSPDGQWLASGDLNGRVFIFNLDSLQHHCTLPTLPYAPSALTFGSESSRYLLLAMPNNTVKIFDVESKSLPEWQRTLSEIVSSRMSAQRDAIIGASFVPSSSSRFPPQLPTTNGVDTPILNGKASRAGTYQSIIVWGANWLCRFRLYPQNTVTAGSAKRRRDEDEVDEENEDADNDSEEEDAVLEIPAPSSPLAVKGGPRAKKDRIRGSGEGELFFTMFTQYRNVLGVEFLNAEEMVVVERPLLDLLSTMPPAYFKAKYGT